MQLAARSGLWSLCLLSVLLGISCSRPPTAKVNEPEKKKRDAPGFYDGKPAAFWIKEMDDPDPEKRSKAAWALGDIRPKAPGAAPVLKRGLKDADARVRSMSAQSLGWLGPIAKDAVPALIDSLKDPNDDSMKWIVAQALGNIGPDAKEAVPALTELLTTQGGPTRGSAVVALGKIGRAAKQAVPKLIELLQAGDEELKSTAAVSLGEIGPDAREAIPALVVAVKGGGATSSAAIKALGEIGPDAKAAVPVLRDVMNAKAKELQVWPPRWVAAARALAAIEPAEAKPSVPDLIALVRQYKNSPRGNVGAFQMYRAASEALEAIDSEAAAKEK
jgi:HEAT repeat protein